MVDLNDIEVAQAEKQSANPYGPFYDQHVRDYYNQPANNYEEYYSSKFEGQSVAVAKAYYASLEGGQYDDFGDVQANGYYCRVLFDDCPYIICFCQFGDGFVSEVSNETYEQAYQEDTQFTHEDDVADFNDDESGNYKYYVEDGYRENYD